MSLESPGNLVGQTLSRYRVTARLGEGGMGVVYRAEDLKLKRSVAIKVLPDAFFADPERVARFEREARLLAALDHPHIAAIYGLEEVDGRHLLVMQLAEGKTLAERIAEGPLPVDEALAIAAQIAEALAAAHDKGIVHRDLKPANVKVSSAGSVKLLDFGLAKAALGDSPGAGAGSAELTASGVVTSEGVVLGTPAYMSPEQARGQPVDRRGDVWAFGCVLYEMLTSRPAFRGATLTDTLAKIVREDPDWSLLPSAVPPLVVTLLRRTLEKDTARRLRDLGDARLWLEGARAEPDGIAAADARSVAAARSRSAWKGFAPWALVPLAAFLGWSLRGRVISTAPAAPAVRFELQLPAGDRFAPMSQHRLALTPDGGTLAFVAAKYTPKNVAEGWQLYVRRLDEWQAHAVPTGEKAREPFFSPDGAWLAFLAAEPKLQLRKVRLEGGEPETICDCDATFGAAWGPDGTIAFADGKGGLKRVSASGGTSSELTRLDKESDEVSHQLPHFLPDGRAILYTAVRHELLQNDWEHVRVFAQPLPTGVHKQLLEGASDARYVPTGHLVFAREGRLLAVRFDPVKLEVEGPELPLVEGVSHNVHGTSDSSETGAADFAVSDAGLLAYAPGSVDERSKYTPVWIDRQGREEPSGIEPRSWISARVSPDGRQVLLVGGDHLWQVWLYDVDRKTLRRQTFEGGSIWAIWEPGGKSFTFDSNHEGSSALYSKALDSGPGNLRKLATGSATRPRASSWSPDGQRLALTIGLNHNDIWIATRDGRAEPWLETTFDSQYPEFSPDGRFVVYASDESGRREVYIRPYPGPGTALLVSTEGGYEPAWSRDGREVFYFNDVSSTDSGRRFFAVPIDAKGDNIHAGQPLLLFVGRYQGSVPVRSWDVAPDGRFLVMKKADDAAVAARIERIHPDRIRVAAGLFADLRKKQPTERH